MDVTVIIPVLNEEDHIGDCLRGLENQTLGRDRFEVIVVDNGSVDRTCDLVDASGAKRLHEPKRSPYAARNRAINASCGKWLAFTDATCIPQADWLEKLQRRADEAESLIVGGLTRYEILRSTLGNQLFYETHLPETMRETVETHQCIAGNNLYVHRALFQRYGLFRELRSGSDIEFSKRVSKQGHRCVFAGDAIVRRQCDLGNLQYLKRSYRIRRGQRIHGGESFGWGSALAEIRRLPWKPGFRAGQSNANPAAAGRHRFLTDWLYRWANRWAGFLGGVAGALRRPSESQTNPPTYQGIELDEAEAPYRTVMSPQTAASAESTTGMINASAVTQGNEEI